MSDKIDRREILITGGSGTLGKALVKLLQTKYTPRGIRIYSRSELRQAEMVSTFGNSGIAYIIGDVRDGKALSRACQNANIIINCAAMKRVDTSEENPLECIQTNVYGAENVVYAALANRVDKVFHISTDKAVYPTTLYGSTKKCAEDLFIQANTYAQGQPRRPIFSVARYGNVFGSNGSVIQTFRNQANKIPTENKMGGPTLTITDQRMTRFWITVEDVAQFIVDRIRDMIGGEIFVPNMPSMSIVDIAKTIAPDAEIKVVGIRGQEKLHECLITEEESPYALYRKDEDNDYYTIDRHLKPVSSDRWKFCSGENTWQLTRDELRKMLEEL